MHSLADSPSYITARQKYYERHQQKHTSPTRCASVCLAPFFFFSPNNLSNRLIRGARSHPVIPTAAPPAPYPTLFSSVSITLGLLFLISLRATPSLRATTLLIDHPHSHGELRIGSVNSLTRTIIRPTRDNEKFSWKQKNGRKRKPERAGLLV